MKTFNLEKVEKLISHFSTERDWDQFHSIKNLAMALSVESSELLEIFQWMSEENSNLISTDPTKMKEVQNEVADILIYLIKISSKLNIDLEQAVVEKMSANELKYPVGLAKGNSKKYNQYE